jgi:hypothetical protein
MRKLKTEQKSKATAKTPLADHQAAPPLVPVHLLTRRQVAERWSCCPHSVARRTDLKPVRFNKRFLRYRLSDIEAIERAATV